MPSMLTDDLLERINKAPSAFPAWVLREAVQELIDHRRTSGASKITDVLITPVEDDEEEGTYAGVLLVCPRPQCLAENQISESDRAERWNPLDYDLDHDGLFGHINGGGDFHHSGFVCASCCHPVTMPADLASNITFD